MNFCNSSYLGNTEFYQDLDRVEKGGYKCNLTLGGQLEEEFCGKPFFESKVNLRLKYEEIEYDCF